MALRKSAKTAFGIGTRNASPPFRDICHTQGQADRRRTLFPVRVVRLGYEAQPVLYLVALKSDDEVAKAKTADYLASVSETCRDGFNGVWFIKSDKDAVELRDALKQFLDPNDRIAIILLAGFAAWNGFDPESEKWLLKHL